MTIFKFALLRIYKKPLALIITILLPLSLMFLRPLWNSETTSQGYYIIALVMMFGTYPLALSILNDKIDGTIIRILASPSTNVNYFLQNLLACILPLLIQIVSICILGIHLYKWDITFSILLALCYTMFAVATVTFTFAWACLFKKRETSYTLLTLFLTFSASLGGLLVPLRILPETFRYIGSLFPAYWVASAIDTLLLDQVASSQYWLALLALLLFSIIYLLYGSKRRLF